MSKKVAILGGGESGVGAALLAQAKGYDVFVSDAGPIPDKFKSELIENEIPFEEKGHSIEKLIEFELVIKSPGVPETAKVLSSLKQKGIKIISEIEFGFIFYSGKLVAITGSNGKTTTSGLTYHLLREAGKDVQLGGNYGISFCRLLLDHQSEILVLETSSFQLDNIDKFKPYISVLLNITPDHLDRYNHQLELYANAKFRIFENQDNTDLAILNGDDPISNEVRVKHKINAKTIDVHESDYAEGIKYIQGKEFFDLPLPGLHNRFNSYVAISIARYLGVADDDINRGLKSFSNDAHRMEEVAKIQGVKYINDSKATNVDAVFYALDAVNDPIVWIAGGTDKGNDYTSLIPLAAKKVKALICLGIDNEKLVKTFAGIIPDIIQSTKVSMVVQCAAEIADEGDTVLLSPACASFDLFENYKDRGDQFKHEVFKLENKVVEVC